MNWCSYQRVVRWGALLISAFVLNACGGGDGDPLSSAESTAQGIDPLLQDFGVAYVKRPLPEIEELNDIDARELTTFTAGGDLYFRELASPRALERNVTGRITNGLGDVKDVEVSYDGTKLLFALRLPEIENAAPEDQPTWNIWEYEIASDTLRRIITSDNVAEDGQDVAPHYLPDGRIIFSSSRQRDAKATLLDDGKPQYSALDESRNEHAMVLHVMRDDGTEIEQVSFNQSHDLDPIVLNNGKVVFTRWDNFGSNNALHLYQMNPDGTGLQLLYGVNSHATGTDGNTVQFLQPREMPNGDIMVLLRPFDGTYLGGDIVRIDTENYVDNTQPMAVNQGVLSGPAQQSASIADIRTDALPSAGGRFAAFYPLLDGTSRILVSWSACRLLEDERIVPCTDERLADPAAVEAQPLYSLYLYDLETDTQLPIFVPQEGIMVSDVVSAQPRALPNIIFDQQPGVELDQALADDNVGVLDIRSVYDFDGAFNALGGSAVNIAEYADPAQTLATERPARFLRIIKAVSIPDRDTQQIPGYAYGRSSAQSMREIIGYAPIEPDGSVKVKVPAGVSLSLSVTDAAGKRISPRHENWLQVKAGETVQCIGCHASNNGFSHGRSGAFNALHSGAPIDIYQYPNTETYTAWVTETMAQARTRIDATAMTPSVDLVYDDVWTDEVAAGRVKDASFAFRFADLSTTPPTTLGCVNNWDATCRVIINYQEHIHPLWGVDRGVNTCTACHTEDNMGVTQVPAGQLDLTDGASDQNGDHYKSYRELLYGDIEVELIGGMLEPVQATDAMGNPLFVTDDEGNLVLDAGGNPIPIYATVAPSMSASGANASARFFAPFATGASHEGYLTPAELKLIAEWLDIGAQYYNNPFDIP